MRPYRIYHDSKSNRNFYLIKGKRRYIKLPANMSQKLLNKININFINEGARRIKRKAKRKRPMYTKKIIPQMAESLKTPFFQTNPITFTPTLGNNPLVGNPIEKSTEDSNKRTIDLLKKIEMIEQRAIDVNNRLIEQTPIKSEPVEKSLMEKDKELEIRVKKLLKEDSEKNLTQSEIKDIQKKRQENIFGKRELFPYPSVSEYEGSEYGSTSSHYKLQPAKSEPRGSYKLQPEIISKSKLPPINAKKLIEPTEPNVPLPSKIKTTLEEQKAVAKQLARAEGLKGDAYKDRVKELLEKKLEGKGIKDGLYNDEIEKITRGVIKNSVVPVIAHNQISSLPNYLQKGKKIFGAIINTNPSYSDGSGNDGYRPGHWVSCIVDARDDFPSIEYFDSLVENKPSKTLIDTLKKIGKKMNPEVMFKFKFNKIQRQKYNSNGCGAHAIKFIEDRMDGKPWSEATGYDHWIKSHPDDSIEGEKEVVKREKVYSKFI